MKEFVLKGRKIGARYRGQILYCIPSVWRSCSLDIYRRSRREIRPGAQTNCNSRITGRNEVSSKSVDRNNAYADALRSALTYSLNRLGNAKTLRRSVIPTFSSLVASINR
jgi:hypothetical protein